METKVFRIPYDVDFLWNGGCRSGDWIDDVNGDHVYLFISEGGSAYVSPEGNGRKWRLYMDRSGHAWRINRWASRMDDQIKEAQGEFEDVIECGMRTNNTFKRHLSDLLSRVKSSSSVNRFSSIETADISFGPWTIHAGSSRMSIIHKGKEREKFISLKYDTVPFAFLAIASLAPVAEPDHWGMPIEHTIEETVVAVPMSAEETADITTQLRNLSQQLDQKHNQTMTMAIRAFEEASLVALELREFAKIAYAYRR